LSRRHRHVTPSPSAVQTPGTLVECLASMSPCATPGSFGMNACRVCSLGISHTRRTHTQQMKQGMLGRPGGPPVSTKDHLEEISLWTPRSATDIHAHISSTPAAADIQVDREFVGTTPLNIDLTCCFHDVTISKPGLRPWTRRVRNTDRQVNIHTDLQK